MVSSNDYFLYVETFGRPVWHKNYTGRLSTSSYTGTVKFKK